MPVSVVICDDAPELRALARYQLEEADIRVIGEAADGAGALGRAVELDPDVMLLDLSMPGMEGQEVIVRMRVASPRTAIVVRSGFAEGHVGDECRALGAHAYIQKGEPAERLIAVVRAAARSVTGELASPGGVHANPRPGCPTGGS